MIDKFTSSVLLHISKDAEGIQEASKLIKEFKASEDGGPSQEAIDFVKNNIGKRCRINLVDYEGIIHGLNSSTCGFYPGSRFPVYVKMTSHDVAGEVFEYPLDQIELI